MPRPISHRKLIAKLKRAGCAGPFSGAKHLYVLKGNIKIFIPNPHGKDIGPKILKRIIQDLGVPESEFEGF